MTERQLIVILGAGFGGLRAALLIAKAVRRRGLGERFRVVLVDRNGYHTYTPNLYEAATTSKETANYLKIKEIVAFPIAEIINGTGIEFLNAKIESLDISDGDIHIEGGQKLKFNYLVLALGSEINYFSIPGLQERALPLKTFMDALKIRDTILNFVNSGKEKVEIVIGGGGSTGVELAGEIKGWLRDIKITIIEAAPTVLPGFTDKIISVVGRRLKRLGVEIITGESIEKANPTKIVLKSRRELPYDILIWTGGVRASGLVGALPLRIEKRGRVEVVGEMTCLPQSPDLKLYGKIYAIGDAVCFYDPKTGNPIPGVARAALSQASVVARNIVADITNTRYYRRYKPMNYPYIIPVSGKWAAAKIGPFVISGFFGWLFKELVELGYLCSIMPFGRGLKLWLKTLWIFIKNDRLG